MCVAADKIAVHHWSGGALADSFVLDASEEGVAVFARYLEESPEITTYLMADMVEEEFRLEQVPHAYGRDRRALLERRKARLFRGTPYVYAELQGREDSGRRDDRVLLTAITNPEILAPWLRLFEQYRVPLAGIYSLPVLSRGLLPCIDCARGDVLLISLHSASGLRQSFFQDGRLKLSRLAKLPRYGTMPFGPYIVAEIDRFRRYLTSLRLPSRDGSTEVVLLAHGEVLLDLAEHCRDSEVLRHRLLDVAEVARVLGLSGVLTTPFSDLLFAHLLLATRPQNQYATVADTRYARMYQTRNALVLSSVLMLFGSAVFSGFNFIEGVALKQESLDAGQKADFYQARFEVAREGLPATVVEPDEIRTGVLAAKTLDAHAASPRQSFEVVSRVLDRAPDLHVDRIDWRSAFDPDAPLTESDSAGAQEARAHPAVGVFQIARITGRVKPFSGDYRAALALVTAFAEALRIDPRVAEVKIESQPIDVSSEAAVQGEALRSAAPHDAGFSVRVVLRTGQGDGAT